MKKPAKKTVYLKLKGTHTRCACGIRIRITRGARRPTCTHIAPSSVLPTGGWNGPADYYRFFEPRADFKNPKGWQRRKPSTDGHKHTPPTLSSGGLDQRRPVDSPRPTVAASVRRERESRRLAQQVLAKTARRRSWAEILPHLAAATDKQREVYRRHVEGGRSLPEIATDLGIKEQAVKDRLSRARDHERTSRRRARMAESTISDT